MLVKEVMPFIPRRTETQIILTSDLVYHIPGKRNIEKQSLEV